MDDYQVDDLPCPACNHYVTHSRACQSCNEDGEVSECCDDLCQDYCIHGDGMVPCRECDGTQIQRWCPACGADFWQAKRRVERWEEKQRGLFP